MTTKVFEAYKNGTYKPYNRYAIILYKPILIKKAVGKNEEPFYEIKDAYESWLDINDLNTINIEFDGNNIIYTVDEKRCFRNHKTNTNFIKQFGKKTYRVNYKNIKQFH